MTEPGRFAALLVSVVLAIAIVTRCQALRGSAPAGSTAPEGAATASPAQSESLPDAAIPQARNDVVADPETGDESTLPACLPPPPTLTDAELEAHETRADAAREQVIRTLRDADDPALRLAAVLLDADSYPDELLLRNLHRLSQRDPLALHALLGECTSALTDPHCDDAGLTTLIERVDGDNSEAWALLAARRLELGETEAAARALERANGSPVTTRYFRQYVGLFERAYAAATGLGVAERGVAAIGHAAGQQLAGQATLLRRCYTEAADSVSWRRLCFEYASQLRAREATSIHQAAAMDLLARLAELDGDDAAAGRLRREADALQTERMEFIERFGPVLDAAAFDDTLMAEYLDELLVHGEQRAQSLLHEQVRRYAHCLDDEPRADR